MPQKRIEIVYRKLTDLIPDEKNPRRNDMAVKPVSESIRQFGMRVPLVIDQQGQIIAGHTRYKACAMLGIAEVPCVVASDLTLKQQRAFQLSDNKTGELAEWDASLLSMELESLASVFEISDFGFERKSKNDSAQQMEPKPLNQTDGFVTCPRCGRQFRPEDQPKHFDPFAEDADEEELF